MADREQRAGGNDDAVSCPLRRQQGMSGPAGRGKRGRAMPSGFARSVREESRVPLLIFLAVVALTLALRSMVVDEPYAKALAIQKWPVVQVSSRNLVDECGVFMWVRWVGPGFGEDAPYIPMRYRYQ